MSEHTETPWSNDGYGGLVGPDGKIVTVWGIGIAHGQRSEETEANARHIVHCVNNHKRLVEVLEECRDAMEGFNRAPGATRDEWEFECEVKEIDTLLAAMEAEKKRGG